MSLEKKEGRLSGYRAALRSIEAIAEVETDVRVRLD